MIKVICLGMCTVSMVALYMVPVPDAEMAREARIRSQDRLFLAELDAREDSSAPRVKRADGDFRSGWQEDESSAETLQVAKAMEIRPPQGNETKAAVAEHEFPVRRAVLVERARPSSAVASSSGSAPPNAQAASGGAVDRAIPTAGSTVTRIMPTGAEVPRTPGRASILIYRGEVIVRPAVPAP